MILAALTAISPSLIEDAPAEADLKFIERYVDALTFADKKLIGRFMIDARKMDHLHTVNAGTAIDLKLLNNREISFFVSVIKDRLSAT